MPSDRDAIGRMTSGRMFVVGGPLPPIGVRASARSEVKDMMRVRREAFSTF